MGKRGPRAKGEYGDKSAVLSTRISADLRTHLEHAVRESGHTLSREIEHRLRRTFIEDEQIASAFGDRQTYLIMRIIALALQRVWNPDRSDTDWLSDPYTFDQALQTVTAILEAIRPKEPIEPLSDHLLRAAS